MSNQLGLERISGNVQFGSGQRLKTTSGRAEVRNAADSAAAALVVAAATSPDEAATLAQVSSGVGTWQLGLVDEVLSSANATPAVYAGSGDGTKSITLGTSTLAFTAVGPNVANRYDVAQGSTGEGLFLRANGSGPGLSAGGPKAFFSFANLFGLASTTYNGQPFRLWLYVARGLAASGGNDNNLVALAALIGSTGSQNWIGPLRDNPTGSRQRIWRQQGTANQFSSNSSVLYDANDVFVLDVAEGGNRVAYMRGVMAGGGSAWPAVSSLNLIGDMSLNAPDSNGINLRTGSAAQVTNTLGFVIGQASQSTFSASNFIDLRRIRIDGIG